MTAKVLMVQGTSSSVGKSVLVAALCRIFRQDGYKVAPFKAQNMSLNSYVTPDGGEVGRAQAVQAEAAGGGLPRGQKPGVLQPEADPRSQVVVLGKPNGSLAARDFYQRKAEFWPVVAGALDRLRTQHDIVVAEGAGSPAEINLKAGDIVNMRVALHAQSPVLLVGDIDRGGVFAALLGTLMLLEPQERALVKGLVINKFRGDLSLLEPGLKDLAQRAGTPVLGVVPYFRDIHVAEEDSVALERNGERGTRNKEVAIDIAVLRLPHISNFDDFDPFLREAGVGLRYAERATDLGKPDLVIIPGAKTTVADLKHIESVGLVAAVTRLAREGTPVIGICGGYQMLGRLLWDPEGIESAEEQVVGLGLLPVATIFERDKQTHRVEGVVEADVGILARAKGQRIVGYEVHMGRTTPLDADDELPSPIRLTTRSGAPWDAADGAHDASGNVVGTYLHGLFHNDGLRRALLEELAARKGIVYKPGVALSPRDGEYDKLAALVRSSLDMRAVYAMLGLGEK